MADGEGGGARVGLDPAAGSAKLRRTFYLDQESVAAHSEPQTEDFRLIGKKPDLSELVNQAIRMLSKRPR